MAFRNILIHGYAVVDDRVVWEVVSSKLEPLDVVLTAMLDDASGTTADGSMGDS